MNIGLGFWIGVRMFDFHCLLEEEMRKTKSIEGRDRLSELPDSLIVKIFEFMPTRDVARTPILSRRWKDLWTINPYLCFHAISGDNNDELRRFVNRTLLRWRGDRVLKFKVSGALFDDSIFTEMDLWLRFAVDYRVEELDISFKYVFVSLDDGVEYCPPNCLYSCSSLQKLSFDCFSLKIDGSVQWSRLKSLNIVCSSVSRQGIEGVLCGSPLLEEFILDFHDKDGKLDLSFRSSSLKKLSIRTSGHTNNKTGLRIWTPNLLELTVSGVSYDCCVLENVMSLARANLFFDWGNFESSNLTLAAIQRVEVLEAMRNKSLLSPFSNVKFLSFGYRFNEHQTIVNFLEIFPMLKTLVIEETNAFADTMRKAKLRPNPSKSFLGELKTVEVTWNGFDFLIFPFIKILLKSAKKLEKMVFRMSADVFSSHNISKKMFWASKELLEMPRSSPTAKLFFHEY